MTSIRIEGCTVDDGPAVARNNVPAFWTNAQWRLIWREKTLEHVTSQAALRMSWNLLRDPIHRRHQKAVDVNTGAVVGYARWILPDPYPDGAVDVRSVWADGKVDAPSEERVKEIDREMQSADWMWDHSLDVMDEPISAAQERLRKGKSYLILDYLAVHPDQMGKGIATQLVAAGLKEADRLNLDVFVYAMDAGLRIYERSGFVLLEKLTLDDSRFGGQGEYGAHFLEKRVQIRKGAS